jgi:hypothetical protein
MLCLLIIIGHEYIYSTSTDNFIEPVHVNNIISTSTLAIDEVVSWKKYVNDKYKFLIEYPSNWQVYENDTIGNPVFTFYPTSLSNDSKESNFKCNFTQVSIYPQGYGSEGFGNGIIDNSERKIAQSSRQINVPLYKTGEIFITQAFFNERDNNWRNGYIIGRLFVKELNLQCISKADQSKCDSFAGDDYEYFGGKIDESNRENIEYMLRSFKFIN